MPKILLMALIARAELARLDDAALAEMASYYDAAWERLQSQFDGITKLIEEAEADGMSPVLRPPGSGVPLGDAEFSANWLFRQRRYYELMDQLEAEMSRLGISSFKLVEKQQRNALLLGLDHAQRLTAAALPAGVAAIRASFNRVPFDAVESLVGFLGDGSPLAYKFSDLPGAVADAVKESLVTGLATGRNPRRIAAEVRKASDGAFVNALTTCRAETLRAYRTASTATYRANDDVVSGWIWAAAEQPETCAACWGMHGSFHPLTKEMVDHPNGRCVQIPVTKSWAELGFKGTKESQVKGWDPEERFARLSEDEQRRVLGRTKFEAWRSGELTLRDIPTLEASPIWGDHYRVKTLQELGMR